MSLHPLSRSSQVTARRLTSAAEEGSIHFQLTPSLFARSPDLANTICKFHLAFTKNHPSGSHFSTAGGDILLISTK